MIRILATIAVIGLALGVVLGQMYPSQTVPSSSLALRILFVGNSFTFGGDVPEQVRQITASAPVPVQYHVESVVQGGTSLGQHLGLVGGDGITPTDALTRVQAGGWDVVVLQDASVMAFHPEGVAQMRAAADVLAQAAQTGGAQVVYFAHWAPVTQAPVTQAADPMAAIVTIEAAYQQLAAQTGGRVARVGQIWADAAAGGVTGLYAADGHHASLTGAYAAALGIVVALDDVDVGATTWAPRGVPKADQITVRGAAAEIQRAALNAD